MLIGEISEETGLSRDTIRFYEKKGLIHVEHTASVFNNYKDYTQEVLQRLQLIKKAKRFGFTLKEIAELLDLVDLDRASCSTFRDKVAIKISEIDKRIRDLEDMKILILREVQVAQTKCMGEIEEVNCGLLQA